jgi:hypothetical protein
MRMKRTLLFIMAMAIGLAAFPQTKQGVIPAHLKNISATKSLRSAVDESLNLIANPNPYTAAPKQKAVNETLIGMSRYDLQTNQSVQNRCYLHSDNTIGAVYTYGQTDPGFADRGTGYNYFDGTAWGAQPTARIETAKCGWPSYAPLGTAGEVVVTHNGNTGLIVATRATKGSGAWTESVLVGPATTGSTTALLWPRTMTVGNTIHIIACTDQAPTGSTYYYQGLALALVYYRSTDGGVTFTGPAILPGMDSASVVGTNNKGFGGDSYAWAAPKGDTIAFIVGDSWSDLFVMKSFDGGDNWTKVPVFNFPEITAAPTPIISTNDGSLAVAIDNAGKAHVVFGKMRVSDDDFSDDQTSYYPYTDGVIYWNENKPVLDTTVLADDNYLFNNGMLIGYMADWDGSDTVDFPAVSSGQWPFGNYYLSLSSMPQINVDGNNIYVTFSSCREDKILIGATPNTQLYRHLFAMQSTDLGATWYDFIDLTDNLIHDYDECIFGSLSYTMDNYLHIVYQADDEPGLAVRGDTDPYNDNRIYYLRVPKADLVAGVAENPSNFSNCSVYPNPASENATIEIMLNGSAQVSLSVTNILGEVVMNNAYGHLAAGKHLLNVNLTSLNTGLYFFTVQAGENRITNKVLVK